MDSLFDFLFTILDESEMSPLFRDIASHMENFAYRVKFENDVLKTDHDSKPKFWVHSHNGAALFMALYPLGSGAKDDRNALLAFVNECNIKSNVAKFGTSGDSLMIMGWYPSAYERHSFAQFFDTLLSEAEAPPTRDPDAVKKLFWPQKDGTQKLQ